MSKHASIRTTTIKRWLDERADKHNSWTYRDYRRMRIYGVTAASRARAFGVEVNTMRNWDAIDNEQNGVPEKT